MNQSIGRYPVNEGYALMLGTMVVLRSCLVYRPGTPMGGRLLAQLVRRHTHVN